MTALLIDPRERAFETLLPIAPVVQRVLGSVDAAIAADTERNTLARAGWTSPQRKTHLGYARFCTAIERLKVDLSPLPGVRYRSTPAQEASNLFLWQVGDFLTLRVKSEPSELVIQQTQPLFPRQSAQTVQTVCLSWGTNHGGAIVDAKFVSVHDHDPWSITMFELLQAAQDVPSIGTRRETGLKISSKRAKQADLGPEQVDDAGSAE